MPQYAIDWCLTIISVNKKIETKPKTKTNIENIVINSSIEVNKFNLETMKIIYKIFLENELFNTYEGWRDIGYMSRHLNNSEEAFKLYDKFCRKVDGYENAPEIDNRKAFYGKNDYNENYDENGVLLKCKKLNFKKYKECLKQLHTSRYKNEINYIDTEFIYNKDTQKMFDDWITEFKVLAIKSPYGTGKTYAFKKIMDKNIFKRVLFITYRQSLAHSLTLELNERYGFENYLDEDTDIKKADRLIIQLDSIHKLIKPFNMFLQKDGIPTFDLIVLDEIEGLLNHLSYSKINQYQIYNYLEKMTQRASKILALDGDMSDRAYDFLSSISDSRKFYVNEYKSVKKNFIFSHNGVNFDKSIDADLKSGKKIAIVCMSKTSSEKYYALYKDKYNLCIHNSIEKNKDALLNVKDEWSKCDLLIYSPSVESGVDFDVKNYFYKCYCVLSVKSTSYRALCQMLNRVRHYENNDILCLIPEQMNWSTDDITYNYDEIRLTKYAGLEINNLVSVLIHNDTEKINSDNYFISSLIQLITSKGHTYKYLKDDIDKSKISGTKIVKEQIINAENISSVQYNTLCDKKIRNIDLTRDENNSFTKYLYYEVFSLDDISDVNDDFLKEHMNKMFIIKNYKALNMTQTERGDKKTMEYFKNFKFDKVDKITELISKFGFKIENKEIVKVSDVDKEVVKKEIETFLMNRKNRTLFNLKKDHEVKYHYNDINNILESYGLELKDIQSSKRENKKVITTRNPKIIFTKMIVSYNTRRTKQQKQEEYERYLQMINDPLNEGVDISEPN